MGDDLLPAARAFEELMPAVQAFSEATGALGPVQELTAWATDLIRYRRAPYQAKLLMSAAKKIRASGLPPTAVEDKLLRAVLEDGPMEDDADMQERWANLLANASTGSTVVRAAFPRILSELEPHEAWILDKALEAASRKQIDGVAVEADYVVMDNLARLGLALEGETSTIVMHVKLTSLGKAFVQACRTPSPAEAS